MNSFQVEEHIKILEEGYTYFSPPSLNLQICFIWLFLSCILYNKLPNIREVFSWVLWTIPANYWTGGKDIKNPWFTVGGSEVWEAWTLDCHLKWGQSCETESFNSGLWYYLQADNVKNRFIGGHPVTIGRKRFSQNRKTHTFGVRNKVYRKSMFVYIKLQYGIRSESM